MPRYVVRISKVPGTLWCEALVKPSMENSINLKRAAAPLCAATFVTLQLTSNCGNHCSQFLTFTLLTRYKPSWWLPVCVQYICVHCTPPVNLTILLKEYGQLVYIFYQNPSFHPINHFYFIKSFIGNCTFLKLQMIF